MKDVVVSGSWALAPLEITDTPVPQPLRFGSGSR